MLLLLTQQGWRMEALNVRHKNRAVYSDISCAVDTVWHPALLSKLSADGIQGQLHALLADFLDSHSQHVAPNRILSSPLPVKAGMPQGIILGSVLFLFLIFINDLSDSGKSSIYKVFQKD